MEEIKPTLVSDEMILPPKEKDKINNIRQIITDTILDFHNYEFPKYIHNYKQYVWFVAWRLKYIEGWQTNISYPLIATIVDTMYSSVYDFGYQFGVEDSKIARQLEEAFDFRGIGKQVFKDGAKELLITGRTFTRDYLIEEDIEDMYFDEKFSSKIKMPSLQHISVFDVFYERVKGIRNSPYKIYRSWMTLDGIKSTIIPLLLKEYPVNLREGKKKELAEIIKSCKDKGKTRFSAYDYNPVKHLVSYAHLSQEWVEASFYNLSECSKSSDLNPMSDSDLNDETSKNLYLNSDKSSYEYVEYFTETERYFFINWYYIGKVKKPRWISDIHEAAIGVIPGTSIASGLSDQLSTLQDIQTTLWNSFLDNVKLLLGPMFEISGNTPMSKTGKLDFKAFKAIRSQGAGTVQRIQLWSDAYIPLQFMDKVQWSADLRAGTNNYVTGWAGAIERVELGITQKQNAYDQKLKPVNDAMDQMWSSIARAWLQMLLKYFTIEELAEYGIEIEKTYDDNNKFTGIIVNGIELKNILDERKINFSYTSMEKNKKSMIRETFITQLPALLQYAPGSINMEQVGKILMDMDYDPDNIFLNKKAIPSGAVTNSFQQNGGFEATQIAAPSTPAPAFDNGFNQAPPEEAPSFPEWEIDPTQMSDEELLNSAAQI